MPERIPDELLDDIAGQLIPRLDRLGRSPIANPSPAPWKRGRRVTRGSVRSADAPPTPLAAELADAYEARRSL